MKKILFACFLLPLFANAQTITTFAGKGAVSGYSGDGGPATNATMTKTYGITKDATGNIYVSDYLNNRIRKIDLSGNITTFAGNGSGTHSGDGGPATAAGINGPAELIMYGSNLYVSEYNSSMVRKIDAAGIISTYAGIGTDGYSGDGGPATAAEISSPYGIGVDNAGNVYIPDQHTNRIRKVSTSGIITTFAGTGVAGYSGDGGPATLAEVHLVDDIKTDATGNVYFCDYLNHVVRKVDVSGIITTVAGTGAGGFSGDGGAATAAQFQSPGGLCFDSYGNLYVSDAANNRVRMINQLGIVSTIAGTGSTGFSGDGGPATNAMLNWTADIAFDSAGNLYFCDEDNYCVRKIELAPTYISDSFKILVNKYCSGPQICVAANHYSPGMYVKTYFGDGTHDSSAILTGGYCGIVTHSYPNSGTYSIKQYLYRGLTAIDSFRFTYTLNLCNSLQVNFYYDGNNNCTKDGTDVVLTQPVRVEVDSAGVAIDTISATSGLFYTAYGSVGTIYAFKVIETPAGFHVTCPATAVIYDTFSATIPPIPKYVAIECITSSRFDLSIHAMTTAGVSDQYGIAYIQNSYCLPENCTVTLHYSPKYNGSPRDIYPAASSVSGNTIVWDVSSLSSTLSAPISLRYGVWHSATLLTIGDTVNSYFTIDPVLGDADTTNNVQTIIDTVKGGCDPNEMWVNPSCIPSGDTATQLQYTINFENTGNDTAHNIYVMDTLPDNVDVSSMRLVMSSNEMYTTHVKDGAGHNILKFDFPGINLPDSSHHGMCDGAVIFTIETEPGLPLGSAIYNRAGIYFDVNPVVMTNVAASAIGCLPERVPTLAHNDNIEIYPNPAATSLIIASANKITTVTVTNLIGQTLSNNNYNNEKVLIDISGLPTGIYLVKINGTEVRKFVKE